MYHFHLPNTTFIRTLYLHLLDSRQSERWESVSNLQLLWRPAKDLTVANDSVVYSRLRFWVLVDLVDSCNILWRELDKLQVLTDTVVVGCLWNDRGASLHTPAEQDLAWCGTDLTSDLVDSLVLYERCVASYWTISGDVNAVLVTVVDQLKVRVPWVGFDLVYSWTLGAVV